MGISVIRKATQEDRLAIRNSAIRFCKRHGIRVHGDESPEQAIDYATYRNDKRLTKLWQQCYCRALKQPYDARLCIAYGHVGLSV